MTERDTRDSDSTREKFLCRGTNVILDHPHHEPQMGVVMGEGYRKNRWSVRLENGKKRSFHPRCLVVVR